MPKSTANLFGLGKNGLKLAESALDSGRVAISKGKTLFKCKVAGFEMSDKIKPKWAKRRMNIFFKEAYNQQDAGGEVLAYFLYNNKRYPAIVLNSGKITFNFDPESSITGILNEEYARKSRPLYTYIPFHYHKIPFNQAIYRFILKFQSAGGYPSWPADNSVDTLRHVLLRCIELTANKKLKTKNLWPGNKKFAVAVTHDVDKEEGLKNAEKFLKLESKNGIVSTWFLLSNYYKIDDSILKRISDKNEIALHGYNHDNKIAYLDKRIIEKRIRHGIEKFKKFHMKGFRSPSLLTSPNLENALSKYFLYDSSVTDTEMFLSDSRNSGCCTVFPFMRNGILHLPITVPIDSLLIFRGFSPQQICTLWKNKLEQIRKIGGLALITTHTESSYTANEKFFPSYKNFVKEISKYDGAWIATCSEIAEWWKKRAASFTTPI